MLRITRTENGLVRGLPAADPRITAFKGIPFAAPPVGELRWRAPQPATDWDGVRSCYEFAPISMQYIPGANPEDFYAREWHVDPQIPMSEDCLYLNVWTPAVTGEEKLPVYVWYFGGAFQCGYTAEMEFDGERLARRGIVVVTVNYRVNVFGFLAHPELTAQQPEEPANFGCLDQQAGLLWVKRNIAAFGGDPENITVGGQSAGGASVMAQLNNPVSAACISRAVIESGIFCQPYNPPRIQTLAELEKQGEAFFRFLGIETVAQARALPAELLRDKMEEFRLYWSVVVDGKFQQRTSWETAIRGELPDIPLLIGSTSDEFPAIPKADTPLQLSELAYQKFGTDAERFLSIIHSEQGIDAAKKNAAVPAVEIAIRALCHHRQEKDAKNLCYVYDFGPEIPGWDHPGAFHSSDLWFFFETLAKCWRPFTGRHYDLARQMCNYLSAFISTGNPNCQDADGTPQPKWTQWNDNESNRMTFYDQPKMEKNPASEIMRFLVEREKME